jgi:succinate dehydrogenase flavin-adding protein (antitoxin of CptAB toxin-antitoxin module)
MTKKNETSDQNRIKKILYSCKYRGCKESELILYNFFTSRRPTLSEEEITLFEQFITLDDAEILDILIRGKSCQNNFLSIVNKLSHFYNLRKV